MPDLDQYILSGENLFQEPDKAFGHFAISEDGVLGVIDAARKLDNQVVFIGTKLDTSSGEDDLWISLIPIVFNFVVSPERLDTLLTQLIPEEEEDVDNEGIHPLVLDMMRRGIGPPIMGIGPFPPGMVPGMPPQTDQGIQILPESLANINQDSVFSLILDVMPNGNAQIAINSEISREDMTIELRELVDYVSNWVRERKQEEIQESDDTPNLDDLLGESDDENDD